MDLLDLAFKSSEAAVDICNYTLGDPHYIQFINYDGIKEISEYLHNTSTSDDYINFENKMMLAEAIWPNKEDWKVKNKGDLRLQTWLFAKDLLIFKELSKDKQETLSSSCVDLSKAAVKKCDELRRYLVA